jgi:hypothetical protein
MFCNTLINNKKRDKIMQKFYMFIQTGAVDSEENWIDDAQDDLIAQPENGNSFENGKESFESAVETGDFIEVILENGKWYDTDGELIDDSCIPNLHILQDFMEESRE